MMPKIKLGNVEIKCAYKITLDIISDELFLNNIHTKVNSLLTLVDAFMPLYIIFVCAAMWEMYSLRRHGVTSREK